MSEVCGDNRFELIGEFKGKLVEGTNIETSPEEMAVLDNFLFRIWQMGWLDKLKAQEPISEQDRKDLDILHRVKEGKLAKSLCYDYVIYNGAWYRNHKWDWPENEPLEPRIIDGEPECGFCLYELRRDADSYCPCCGRKIKWE